MGADNLTKFLVASCFIEVKRTGIAKREARKLEMKVDSVSQQTVHCTNGCQFEPNVSFISDSIRDACWKDNVASSANEGGEGSWRSFGFMPIWPETKM